MICRKTNDYGKSPTKYRRQQRRASCIHRAVKWRGYCPLHRREPSSRLPRGASRRMPRAGTGRQQTGLMGRLLSCLVDMPPVSTAIRVPEVCLTRHVLEKTAPCKPQRTCHGYANRRRCRAQSLGATPRQSVAVAPRDILMLQQDHGELFPQGPTLS